MAQEYETLLSVFKDHTAIVNTLWGIFQAVGLAFLGFVYSQDHVRRNAWVLAGLSIGFVIFAIGNQKAILRSQAVLRAAQEQFHDPIFVETIPSSLRGTVEAHTALSVEDIRRAHITFTLGVTVGAWLPFVAAALRRWVI